MYAGEFRSGNTLGAGEYDLLLTPPQVLYLAQKPSAEVLVADVFLSRTRGFRERRALEESAATLHVTVEVDAEAKRHGRQKGTESIPVQRGVGGCPGHGFLNAVLGVLKTW